MCAISCECQLHNKE